MGLVLAAFVYVPFGEGVMCVILEDGYLMLDLSLPPAHQVGIWDVDRTNVRAK
jgi:hypothetical protein